MATQRPVTDASQQQGSETEDDRVEHNNQEQGQRPAPLDQSPIAAETAARKPATRRGRPPKAQATRTVREYVEPVPAADQEQGQSQDEESFEFVDESPLSVMAESAVAECHVERVGPGKGEGWGPGMAFDFGDGRGPVNLSTGPVGRFGLTADLLDRVVDEVGGARFKFIRQGKAPYEQVLPGPPQEFLPMERRNQPYPNGAMPGPGGGFSRRPSPNGGFGFPEENVQQEQTDPFQAPDYDPTMGVPAEQLQSAQAGLNGFYRGGPYNQVLYYVNGVPTRPPRGLRAPAALFAPTAGAGFGGIDPSVYDHSQDQAPKSDPEVKELLRILVAGMNKPAVDPMGGMVETMRVQLEADRARWERENTVAERRAADEKAAAERKAAAEKEAADRKAAADEAERKARWESEREQRANEFKVMMARLDREKDVAETNQGNSVRIAEINAAAEKDKAAAAVASVERMANIQSQASQQVIAAITGAANKGDPIATFSRGMEVAGNLMGNRGTIGELSQAARDLVPTVVDGVVAIKTMNAQAAANPGTPGQPAAATTDDDMIGRFIALLIASFHKRVDPAIMPTVLGGACVAANYQIEKLDPILKIGTPGIIAAYLQAAADKAVDEGNKKRMLDAKALISSPEGSAWFNQVKAALTSKQGGQAPLPPQIQGPSAPAAK
jgi:chemotaxis protein histidine kinase CheA